MAHQRHPKTGDDVDRPDPVSPEGAADRRVTKGDDYTVPAVTSGGLSTGKRRRKDAAEVHGSSGGGGARKKKHSRRRTSKNPKGDRTLQRHRTASDSVEVTTTSSGIRGREPSPEVATRRHRRGEGADATAGDSTPDVMKSTAPPGPCDPGPSAVQPPDLKPTALKNQRPAAKEPTPALNQTDTDDAERLQEVQIETPSVGPADVRLPGIKALDSGNSTPALDGVPPTLVVQGRSHAGRTSVERNSPVGVTREQSKAEGAVKRSRLGSWRASLTPVSAIVVARLPVNWRKRRKGGLRRPSASPSSRRETSCSRGASWEQPSPSCCSAS
ncbi:uncharacterized protein LOC144119011 [Amblyomma americanum]